jgi:hypothetical protein
LANTLAASFKPGFRAIREQIRPFLLIQACVLGSVAAYYNWPAFAAFAGSLAQFKASGGLASSFVSTMFAGMVLPELFKFATGDRSRFHWHELVFLGLVFGLNGVIVDLFYQFQGYLFGYEATLEVVAKKVLLDQIFAAPLLFSPYFVLMYLWKDSNFKLKSAREALRKNSLLQRLLPVVFVNWLFWIPALCGVYAMPQNLQFVLFLFVEAAWSLIVVHVSKSMNREMERYAPAPKGANA